MARSLHVSEDDEFGLLIHLGADTVGNVQIVESRGGRPEPSGPDEPINFRDISFS